MLKRWKQKRWNRYLPLYLAMLMLCIVSELALASEPGIYQFLPAQTVVSHVRDNLQTHGVDVSALAISADDQGVVHVSGKVASKLEADHISRWAMHSVGVYGVLGTLRYATPQPDDTRVDGAPVELAL